MKRSLAVAMAVAVVALSSFAVVGRASAAVTSATGTITTKDKSALSGSAVAIVTLVDQTASPEAGGVLGQQRIEGLTALPAAFAVEYDDARIDPAHSYAIIASVVDGPKEWNTDEPVPVITGGPSVNVEVPVIAAAAPPATIAGSIVLPPGTDLSALADSEALLIKQETGTLVSVDTDPQIEGDSTIVIRRSVNEEEE